MAILLENDEELENELNRGALWAITYGDFMSYLMIFFLILFTFAISGKGRFAEGIASMQKQFGGLGDSENIRRQRSKERELTLADDMVAQLQF